MDSSNHSQDSKAENAKGPDKEVEEKLKKLEQNISKEAYKETNLDLPIAVSSDELIKADNPVALRDDLYYFSGLALIGFSLLVFFQHVRLGTGLLQAFGIGGGGFGLLFIPLLIGIALIVYNSKKKIGYAIVSIMCALIFYTVISSLIMTFAPMSLLGLIIMLAPLAVGASFVVRGMGGPKGIEYKLRQKGIIKTEIGEKSNTQ